MYDHKKIDKKWQKIWKENKIYKTSDLQDRPKYYVLDMFPYPSGAGLHVGHPKGYIATDVCARFKMMNGFNVLHPMGWDAFGLPAENYAIANKVHPRAATEKNIATFKRQLGLLGFTYDWDREINTTDPEYYKWTQWTFIKMFERGLAYESNEPINWCPKCQTSLSNEDLEDGKCERCGSDVERKPMRQWVLKITDYADRLLNDLEKLPDWEESIKEMQRNWIGRSEGVNLRFKVKGSNIYFEMYDSIPQTHMAQTFTVIAPEHPKLYELVKGTEFEEPVMKKAKEMIAKQLSGVYEKTVEMDGIFTGRYVEYPLAKRELPIWVASFVVADYGTGVVNCSFHDERDYAFAKKFNIPLHPVLFPKDQKLSEQVRKQEIFYREPDGILEEPVEFKGRRWDEAREDIIKYLVKNGWAKRAVNYKLRDWVFSRQRYWGEPIPLIHCENCKNKKYNYIIIHGYGGSPEVNFFQWLKEELEKLGHTAVCPELPNTDEPNVDEQADYIINNFEINNNTVLVGHSLGGVVAMRLLEKTNKKVSKVLFVDSFIDPNFDDVDRVQVEKSTNWDFDFEKIKSLAGEFVVLADKSYAVVPKDQPQKMAELFDATVIMTNPNEWHFCGESEPEVLKLSLDQGIYPVSEKDLPLELPDVKNYGSSGTGESPLVAITEWVNTKCPKCGGHAKRETNTMPQWAGSCWYYLRYIDPKNNEKLVDPKKEKYWQPVDLYVGGAEHATRHLIYSRFWHYFLFDIGVVSTPEPFTKLQHVGLIMAEDGRKMSKRWNNVINPDDVVDKYGADAMRVYEMFMGPFDNAIAWSTEGLVGSRRFLERAWKLKNKINPPFAKGGWGDFENKKLESLLHKTIKKVTNDIQSFKFNTAISAMMIFLNNLEREKKIDLKYYSTFLQLLSPFAPHIAEELWEELENKESIFKQSWPKYDESLIKDEEIELVVQINGKIRDKILVSADITEEEAKEKMLSSEKIQQWLGGKEPKKIIFVKGRLVSIVV